MIPQTRHGVNILHTAYNLVIKRLGGFTNYELEHWSNHGKILMQCWWRYCNDSQIHLIYIPHVTFNLLKIRNKY